MTSDVGSRGHWGWCLRQASGSSAMRTMRCDAIDGQVRSAARMCSTVHLDGRTHGLADGRKEGRTVGWPRLTSKKAMKLALAKEVRTCALRRLQRELSIEAQGCRYGWVLPIGIGRLHDRTLAPAPAPAAAQCEVLDAEDEGETCPGGSTGRLWIAMSSLWWPFEC